MTSISRQFRERQRGYDRGITDRYSENKWEARYRAMFSLASPWEGATYLEVRYGPCAEPPIGEDKPTEPEQSPMDAGGLARSWLRSEQCLAVVPTMILVGMYGAAAFSLLSIGPAWAGFLAGAFPISALAYWAISSPLRS